MLLMPIFVGFLVTHGGLIVCRRAGPCRPAAGPHPRDAARDGCACRPDRLVGGRGIVLLAFALGGGTYTGIEAVSNNIHMLREPRIGTGQVTMIYMAVSLAFAAGGLILLYLLWNVHPQYGQTLNAVTFRQIPAISWVPSQSAAGIMLLGPSASPRAFSSSPPTRAFSADRRRWPIWRSTAGCRTIRPSLQPPGDPERRVLMAAAAIAILVITHGRVDKLVVLYSINVFISFVLSFTGLSRHWLRRRIGEPRRPFRIFVAIFGFLLTATILVVTTINKFAEGAWMTVVITGCIIAAGLMIRRHYDACGRLLSQADALFATTTRAVPAAEPPPLRRDKPTAIFLVGGSLGTGMHTLLATRKLFPEHFSNYVFIRVGEVDSDSFRHAGELETLRQRVDEYLAQFVNYCHRRQLAATAYGGAAADATAELTQLLDRALVEFPNSMVFASQLVFKNESFLTRLLHGQTPLIMQRRLQNRGIPMLILPMKL